MCKPSCMCHDARVISNTFDKRVMWCWECGELTVTRHYQDKSTVEFYPVGQAPEDM